MSMICMCRISSRWRSLLYTDTVLGICWGWLILYSMWCTKLCVLL